MDNQNSLLSDLLAQAKEMKDQIDIMRPLEPDIEKRILDQFRLDWNFHSNHIEGNSLTYGETKMLLLYGITSGGKPLRDALEIKGHNEALNWVLDIVHGDYPLTETFIRELNEKILGEPYEMSAVNSLGEMTKRTIYPGQYKTSPNHVITKTGEIFRFAEPFEVGPKMHDLIDWYREERENIEMNPIFLATEFHYRFIRIHPFDDGNGRTARILMNFILMQYGYPPAIIRTEKKDEYYLALEKADSGDLGAFFEYVTREVIRTLDIMMRGIRGENIEEDDTLDKEIRLLKGIMKTGNQKFGSREEKIQFLIENTIIPVTKKIFHSFDDFEDFYNLSSQEEIFIHVESNPFNIDRYNRWFGGKKIFSMKDMLPIGGEKAITYKKYFHGLNTVNGNNGNAKYTVFIQWNILQENYYECYVRTSQNGTDQTLVNFRKTYSESLTEKEQETIIRLLKQDHVDFIKSYSEEAVS